MENSREQFDAVIIGTGQGGKPLAISLAGAGWKTAIIEEKYVGGTCINYGCTPTKTMVASARVAYLARRASDYGVNIPQVSVDLSKVVERKNAIVESWRESGAKSLENAKNLAFLRGTARFTGPRQVEVVLQSGKVRVLEADKIVINTGGKPVMPDIEGLPDVNAMDSTGIMELNELPEHLIVMGGGYVGVEFAQMFRRFGSRVTIIQRGNQLLPREDEDVASEVKNILEEDGIDILLSREVIRVEKTGNSQIRATVHNGDPEQQVSGSHLLVAVGRAPNTAKLNLLATGLSTDKRGYIGVNDKLETEVPGIFAIGDVKPGPAFTHISYDDFRILKANLLDGGNATIRGRLVPSVVFIDPQFGRVGLSEKEATLKGIKYRVGKLPMNFVARALEVDEARGFMKVIVDAGNDQILGCAILGLEGGEIMSAIQLAMMGGLPYTKIRDGIFAHPTLAESLNNLFMNVDN